MKVLMNLIVFIQYLIGGFVVIHLCVLELFGNTLTLTEEIAMTAALLVALTIFQMRELSK